MAKVLLLSPTYVDLYGRLNDAAGRYFPLGLGYVSSYLRTHGGHEVAMYEPEAQRLAMPDIERIVASFAPDVVGVTCATPNFIRAIDLARMVKRCSRARVSSSRSSVPPL